MGMPFPSYISVLKKYIYKKNKHLEKRDYNSVTITLMLLNAMKRNIYHLSQNNNVRIYFSNPQTIETT